MEPETVKTCPSTELVVAVGNIYLEFKSEIQSDNNTVISKA